MKSNHGLRHNYVIIWQVNVTLGKTCFVSTMGESRVHMCLLCIWMSLVFICVCCVYGWISCSYVFAVYIGESRVHMCLLCIWVNLVFTCVCCVYALIHVMTNDNKICIVRQRQSRNNMELICLCLSGMLFLLLHWAFTLQTSCILKSVSFNQS